MEDWSLQSEHTHVPNGGHVDWPTGKIRHSNLPSDDRRKASGKKDCLHDSQS